MDVNGARGYAGLVLPDSAIDQEPELRVPGGVPAERNRDFRGKTKAFETAPLADYAGLNAKSKAAPVTFAVPLEKLEPGRYTCQISLLNPGAQKFSDVAVGYGFAAVVTRGGARETFFTNTAIADKFED